MKKKFLLIALVVSQSSCAATHRPVAMPRTGEAFNEQYHYEVRSTSWANMRDIPGKNLTVNDNKLHIASPTGGIDISLQEIQRIEGTGYQRKGSYALPGMGIGFATGAVTALIGTAATSCKGAGDIGDCEGLKTLAYFILPVGVGTITGLIGLGVGFLIPKHEKISITPIVAPSKDGSTLGAALKTEF